ncbi:MAG TPA: 5-keto-L-gluconate epimerase [Anaerolineales bacterium]|nr:5-keto-L-gluconate epimerase [Anaerolineales bacterium]
MKLSVVLSTQPAQFQAATFKGNLKENLKLISGLGYGGVELAIRDPKLINEKELISLLNEYGLRVPAIGTGQAWGEEGLSFTGPDAGVREAAIKRINSHIPIASKFGAIIIIGLIRGIVKPGVDPKQAMDWLVEALKRCCGEAEKQGVMLALEPINRYETTLINSTTEGLTLIEQVKAKNFGLLLDTFHMNIEEAVIEESIRKCGNHILHFHVADSNRWYPGAGHLNFKGILSALFRTRYEGWISGEFLPEPDAETAAEKNYSEMIKFSQL